METEVLLGIGRIPYDFVGWVHALVLGKGCWYNRVSQVNGRYFFGKESLFTCDEICNCKVGDIFDCGAMCKGNTVGYLGGSFIALTCFDDMRMLDP
eukprot:10999885-Ditylum_brightwellii.AAC.1